MSNSTKSRKRNSQLTEESTTCTKKSMKNVLGGPGKTDDQKKGKYSVPSNAAVQSKRLKFSFYEQDCDDLAKALLGKIVVRICDGKRLTGKIVETEAYMGPIDKAAHSYNGKKTKRNTAMFMAPGTAYVYNIYGIYCCWNISAKGDGAAVLIRALEPLENLEIMDKLRPKGKDGVSHLNKKNGVGLCNGPGKLCQALDIKKDSIDKLDLCSSDEIWLEQDEAHAPTADMIVKCKRIHVNYGKDWVDKPLRFYIVKNDYVSVRDKLAEKALQVV